MRLRQSWRNVGGSRHQLENQHGRSRKLERPYALPSILWIVGGISGIIPFEPMGFSLFGPYDKGPGTFHFFVAFRTEYL